MGLLSGKRILITGIANQQSIAFGIAKTMYYQGAELAFTYQNSRIKNKVEKIANQLGSTIFLPCNVAQDQEIEHLFNILKKFWTKFDGLIHSIGYAPRDQLKGDYINTITRDAFKIAHDISSYSFVALAKACRRMLTKNAALLTLSYLGSERVIPNYNVMGLAKASLEANVRYMANSLGPDGVRVNAISSGPIRTLAASGIKNFRKILSACEFRTPLRRGITIEDIGNAAVFLCSNLAAGITGEILHVDGGFNICALNEIIST
ncbi:MAG: SDR family oxidoreductase [Candidatus Dasytiphilus stammeri]